MPKHSNVTLNHVRAAIEQIEAGGKRAAIRRVMSITGGTTADVSEMVKTAQKLRSDEKRALATLNPKVFAAIQNEVDDHVAVHVAVYAQEMEQHEAHMNELHEFLRDAEISLSDDEVKIASLTEQLAAVTKKAEDDREQTAKVLAVRELQLQAKEDELVVLRQELTAVRIEVAGLQHLSVSASELKHELSQTREDLLNAERRAATSGALLEEMRKQRQGGKKEESAAEKPIQKKPLSSD